MNSAVDSPVAIAVAAPAGQARPEVADLPPPAARLVAAAHLPGARPIRATAGDRHAFIVPFPCVGTAASALVHAVDGPARDVQRWLAGARVALLSDPAPQRWLAIRPPQTADRSLARALLTAVASAGPDSILVDTVSLAVAGGLLTTRFDVTGLQPRTGPGALPATYRRLRLRPDTAPSSGPQALGWAHRAADTRPRTLGFAEVVVAAWMASAGDARVASIVGGDARQRLGTAAAAALEIAARGGLVLHADCDGPASVVGGLDEILRSACRLGRLPSPCPPTAYGGRMHHRPPVRCVIRQAAALVDRLGDRLESLGRGVVMLDGVGDEGPLGEAVLEYLAHRLQGLGWLIVTIPADRFGTLGGSWTTDRVDLDAGTRPSIPARSAVEASTGEICPRSA